MLLHWLNHFSPLSLKNNINVRGSFRIAVTINKNIGRVSKIAITFRFIRIFNADILRKHYQHFPSTIAKHSESLIPELLFHNRPNVLHRGLISFHCRSFIKALVILCASLHLINFRKGKSLLFVLGFVVLTTCQFETRIL